LCSYFRKNILDKVVDENNYRKPIKGVSMVGKGISFSTGKGIVTTYFEVTLEGQKKKPVIGVLNTHCQFCGEKLN